MSLTWEECLKQGDELFQYMIHNYESMFDGDLIKHFDIWYVTWWMQTYYENVKEECYKDIQTQSVPWIRKEFETNNLFNSKNWKPFREAEYGGYMYLGYRKIFVYKQYYFQLQIEATCSDCIHCLRNENPIHFELGLYGWKDTEEQYRVLPYDNIVLLPDNMMSDDYWNNNK
jgi:hypothetical protein